MKKNLVILFGGQSSEHAVSCVSARNVAMAIDRTKYQVIPVGITREGAWIHVPETEDFTGTSWEKYENRAYLLPDATRKCLLMERNGSFREIPVDIVFPVLHGLYGEDGTIQGLLEMAKIPYVGCGTLASAVAMDKIHTKMVVERLGIRQARYVALHAGQLEHPTEIVEEIVEELGFPVFVKPSRAGSSCGVSKATDEKNLLKALHIAAENDVKILVEEAISGREVECAVLGGLRARASGVGEILAAAEFYDYEAKYHNADSKTDTSPVLPEGAEEEIRQDAIRIFKAIDGYGLSRVDFFLSGRDVIFNEINTMPGFTSISMYPMLWEKQGIRKEELIQQLLDLAMHRNG